MKGIVGADMPSGWPILAPGDAKRVGLPIYNARQPEPEAAIGSANVSTARAWITQFGRADPQGL